ncbi:acyltransferase [Winogradskyella undariae]|uniref:acyltransferase n=1 Tax=Winogradskyella undariae TaxID=1285465 RepID=UPI00156B3929|nr:acyltransferase [Winogradskyella undariae]NRR91029.1 acyltransferase [Winogradskyella undariae]
MNEIKFFYSRFKLSLLYKDCVTVGKNFKAKNLDIQLHPENAKITFGDDVQLREHAVFRLGKNSSVEIKDGFFTNKGLSINALGRVAIGSNTIIGEDVKIYDHNHGYKNKALLIKNQPYSIGSVEIGDNCWIGSNVVILKNVNIGDNCIIGANCVVYKSLKANSLVNLSTI